MYEFQGIYLKILACVKSKIIPFNFFPLSENVYMTYVGIIAGLNIPPLLHEPAIVALLTDAPITVSLAKFVRRYLLRTPS